VPVREPNGKEGLCRTSMSPYEEMQAAARRLQVPVIRLRAATAVTAAVVVALPCVQSGTHGRNGTSACSPHAGYDRGQRVVCRVRSRHRGRPGSGKGANVRKVVATYKAGKYNTGGELDDSSARFH